TLRLPGGQAATPGQGQSPRGQDQASPGTRPGPGSRGDPDLPVAGSAPARPRRDRPPAQPPPPPHTPPPPPPRRRRRTERRRGRRTPRAARVEGWGTAADAGTQPAVSKEGPTRPAPGYGRPAPPTSLWSPGRSSKRPAPSAGSGKARARVQQPTRTPRPHEPT